MTELERVALLARRFGGAAQGAGVMTGIGDDAAVLAAPGQGALVWTIDAQVEGTHFRRAWLSWEDVGWRSFMAAASDLAAMGASPAFALSALSLDATFDDGALDALSRGQADAAAVVAAPIVGGNLARGAETSITTTLLGRVDRAVLRSGARPGDGLYLAGDVGLAGAGLAALQRGAESDPGVTACVQAWRRPRARIQDGLAMAVVAHAAIDVSDGLARDAHHLAAASSVALVLEESALRTPLLDAAALALGGDALAWILGGGEDYALLVASPAPIEGFVRVGSVEAGAPAVILVGQDGARSDVPDRGFDHFASS